LLAGTAVGEFGFVFILLKSLVHEDNTINAIPTKHFRIIIFFILFALSVL